MTLAPAALEALTDYDFPGNVRELGNIIERLVILTVVESRIDASDVKGCLGGRRPARGGLYRPGVLSYCPNLLDWPNLEGYKGAP